MSKVDEILSRARDSMTVGRVYGEPYVKNGITLIPAAFVRGGGGAGEGEGSEDTPAGAGGGFGLTARPVGAYRIEGDEVSWIPATDVSRIIIGAEILVLVAMLVVRSILKLRQAV